MAMKDWLYRLQSLQLGVVLFLSLAFFSVQLLLSHFSHALTLLVNTYHMLCNIIALGGCIYALKHTKQTQESNHSDQVFLTSRSVSSEDNRFFEIELVQDNSQESSTQRIHNTFGWTRVDVLSMLIVCLLLASWCFSIFVEALQTLVHLDHAGDSMHYPIYVMILGFLGIVLNFLCYVIIGGYTFHQGSFLSINQDGDVVLNTIVSGEKSVTQGCKQLSRDKDTPKTVLQKKRQSKRELCRDMCSSVFVIICSALVYFCEESKSKYIDPILAIISCIVLLYLSYPFMKESGLVLLQTIPDSIDINTFRAELVHSFKGIISVHDLHIWQLTRNKYVSTVHIVFQDPKVFASIIQDVEDFFLRQGIANVTIQPEFYSCANVSEFNTNRCLVQCRDLMCKEKYCCTDSVIPASPAQNSTITEQGTIISSLSIDTAAATPKNEPRLLASDVATTSNRDSFDKIELVLAARVIKQ